MNRPKPPVSGRQVKKIVALGKKRAETAFPNPGRIGCPDPGILRAMAYRDKRLNPSELPVSHVASCSPCFREYMHHRRNAKLTRAIQSCAGPIAILAVLAATVFLVLTYWWRPEAPSLTQRPPVERPERKSQPPKLPAPLAMTIDLAQFSPTRSDTAPARRILFPAQRIRATFLMPIGAEPGEYLVRVIMPNKETLIETRAAATSKDGITAFDVDLQLEAYSQNSLQLMIRPPGLSWRTFPVLVE